MSTELSPELFPQTPVAAAALDANAPIEEATPWRRYLAALWRARVIILTVTIVGSAVGIFASRYATLSYRAHATLWVEVANPGEAARGPIRTGELLQNYAWVELLRTSTVLDHAVRERHLYVQAQDPADADLMRSLSVSDSYRPGEYRLTTDSTGTRFLLTADNGAEVERGVVGGPIGASVGFVWNPAPATLPRGRTIAFRVDNVRERSIALGERLETQMIENSSFLGISLTGPDPEETAATLQSVTERFLEVAAQLKRANLEELTVVLEEQVRYAEENLRLKESALESFRINTITLPSETSTPIAPGIQVTQDPVLGSFFDLQIQREQLRSDREALQDILAQVRDSTLTVDALSAVPAVQQSASLTNALAESARKHAELRVLLQRYTGEHRPVIDLRNEIATLEGEAIPGLVVNLLDQLQAQERMYDGRIGSASRELEQIPPRAIEEARRQRQVEIADNLHGTLRQRYEEARLAAASSIPDIRPLDDAVIPTAPISDPRPLIILLSIFGSLGIAVVGTLAKEITDSRVRYPDQITSQFGLQVLGAIPHVTRETENAADVLEAFREIRLGLVHAHGAAGPMMLTVTSPESGDGKSFVVANLAVAFAQRGDRTLVIDADVRRGKAHHLLGTTRTPGLTDFLAGRVTLDEILQPTARANLFMIGAGSRMRSAPELLGTPRLPALLNALRSRFDAIIVDSPPLGAGADPYVLSTVTRDVLVILRTGTTDRAFAEAKLAMMDRLPVRILGAVLNDFVPGKLYRYYSYLPGYTAEDDTGEDAEEGVYSLVPAMSAGEANDQNGATGS